MIDIQCVVETRALLGEGPCWDSQAQCLWWVDIYGQAIHRYEPATGGTQTFATPQGIHMLERSGVEPRQQHSVFH
jgi:sugar lactone lactonase YvrE